MCTLLLTILLSRATTVREGIRNRTSSIRTRIITRTKGTSKKDHKASIRKKEEIIKAAGSEEQEHHGEDREEEEDLVEVEDIREEEAAS